MFGRNLTKLRKQKGWSQEKLADELNVSRQTIYAWETGGATPDASKLLAIKQLFNVSVDDLLDGQNLDLDKIGAEVNATENKIKYSNFYKNFALTVAAAVIVFGSGTTFTAWLARNGDADGTVAIPTLIGLVICAPLLIYFLLQVHANKKLARENFFTDEDKSNATKILAVKIATAVGLFAIGIVLVVLGCGGKTYCTSVTPNIAAFLMLMWISFGLVAHGIIARRKFVVRKNDREKSLANILRGLTFFAIFLPSFLAFWILGWRWCVYVALSALFFVIFMSPIVKNIAHLANYLKTAKN
jgi:transcriptional regulator with XRE-family HTH domain